MPNDPAPNRPTRPNVVLVITDDQGYPDLGCTGNPWLRTPNIDRFAAEAVRCDDFHVQPLCTPTRGAIMSGHRPAYNGAWATCWGRSLLDARETTLGDLFAAAGYRTGMFGKWHLGDNYPFRPQDRGFEHVVAHKGGGVGQTPDFWGNNYFDDTYFHNGRPVEHTGYCTDVWFEQAMAWIERTAGEPFFCYVATNAPHSPYLVADEYRRMYEDIAGIREPAFYGMITNIDENFAKLRAKLAELGIEDDTILVFMTDNGSSASAHMDETGHETGGYNANLRGMKGSFYDGGHKVPFLLRWPGGALTAPRAVTEMCLDVDLLPTFVDLCDLPAPEGDPPDGVSIAPLLRGQADRLDDDRVHFLHNHQGTEPPDMWKGAAMTRRWRLVGGRELYDIAADPSQRADVADEHPDVVERLRGAYQRWYRSVAPRMREYCPIVIGHDAENPTRLDAMDVMGDVAWHQTHIVQAKRSTGQWTVRVARAGRYRFRLRRWPEELGLPVDADVDADEARRHIYAPPDGPHAAIHPTGARLGIAGAEWTRPVAPGDMEATFEVDLEPCERTALDAWFTDGDDACGAYYVYVERLD
ncbi:MAG: arylsulfatase [Planctomycetota bacterium]